MKKVTVIGDIMVEPPFMRQVERGGVYDFTPSFLPLKSLFTETDYLIGNLETPLAGEESGYTSKIVSFNSPDSLVDALKQIGMDAVSTANNHCLDRGYEGLVRTHAVLDSYGIAHTGTYEAGFSGDRVHFFTVGDTRFALIAYTLSTNYGINRADPPDDRCVNMLHPLKGGPAIYRPLPKSYYDTLAYVEGLMGRKLEWEEYTKLKRVMQMPKASVDAFVNEEVLSACYEQIAEDYRHARENADIVLFCPHSGGQFNEEPGAYTIRVVEKAVELGFDAVFAAHAHTTQRAEFVAGKPCFYSMGNVSMSPGTFYSVPECLPEYGLAAHLYIEDKTIAKVTFSIFKMVEADGDALRVIPVEDLYRQLSGEEQAKLAEDVAIIHRRVTGRDPEGKEPQKEYPLG